MKLTRTRFQSFALEVGESTAIHLAQSNGISRAVIDLWLRSLKNYVKSHTYAKGV